jgi:hypothetical protein
MTAAMSAWLLLAVCAAAFAGWWVFCLRHIGSVGSGASNSHGPVHVVRNRGRVVFAGAGVPAPSSLRFEVKAENALDRLAKRLGISVEGQMGDAVFDRAFYLMCDDAVTLAALQREPALRTALLELAGGQVPAGFRFASLSCANGLLFAQYRNTRWFRDVDPDTLTGGLQLRLQRIAQHLPARGGDTAPADARRRASYLVTTTAFGAFFVGAFGALWIHHSGLPQIVDAPALWALSAALALAWLVAGWRWTWRRLGRTSRAHLALLQLVVVGAPGAWLCAMILVRQVDIGLDWRTPLPRTGFIEGFHVHTYRRAPDRYSIDLRVADAEAGSWHQGYVVRVRLDDAQLAAAGSDGPVRLVERRGALGLRWIERVEHDEVLQRAMDRVLREGRRPQ